MVKITLPINKINQFLELIRCSGQAEDGSKSSGVISEFAIKAFDNKIEAFASDKYGKIFANVIMTTTVIEPGQFTIGDVDVFTDYVNVFEPKDIVTMSQDSGTIKISRDSPKKVATFSTVGIDNIETHQTAEMINNIWKFNDDMTELGTEKTKLSNLITIKAEDMAQVVNDSAVVGEHYYPFVVMKDENGQLILKVEIGSLQTSMGVIKSLIPAVINSVELNNKYAYGFDNVFLSLKGEVKLFTAPGMPLWIVKQESDYQARYMLTPVVD